MRAWHGLWWSAPLVLGVTVAAMVGSLSTVLILLIALAHGHPTPTAVTNYVLPMVVHAGIAVGSLAAELVAVLFDEMYAAKHGSTATPVSYAAASGLAYFLLSGVILLRYTARMPEMFLANLAVVAFGVLLTRHRGQVQTSRS